MKKLTIALVLIASTAFAGEVITRGAAIPSEAKAIPLATVLENPDAYTKDAVVAKASSPRAARAKAAGCSSLPPKTPRASA